ncbi:MAG: glycerol-3-phosphate dehydrogenase/oxidase, partial [Chitinophagaceae bacterium]|nr:glycerol-3-phosphate dehydrogenase/oxidase [Chitinophagaceae bacterium]
QTAAENNAVVLNYFPVTGLMNVNDKITGVSVTNSLSGKKYEVKSKIVINATGVFTDAVLNMDNGEHENIISPSQGIHLVLDKEFLPGESAIMIPHTDDGRVLFAVPWHNRIILGTTDSPVSQPSAEPVAMKDEIDFLLKHIGRYLTKDPQLSDVKSIFAGLRPLVKSNGKTTAALSRDHLITVSNSGLITITGGKWTTYRHMAEDVIDIAIASGGLADIACKTKELAIHGAAIVDFKSEMYYFGSDKPLVQALAKKDASLKEKIHPSLPYIKAEIVWAVRHEMCMTVEDALSRRTRAILLDAKAAIESAPVVAAIMAKEMNKDAAWEKDQVAEFNMIAKNYLPS